MLILFSFFSAKPTYEGHCTDEIPCTASRWIACDMNYDDMCNVKDINLFHGALGCCVNTECSYSTLADQDHDRCVTEKDMKLFYDAYKEENSKR